MSEEIDNNWVAKFFKLVGKNRAFRTYECTTCGCFIQTRDGKEIDEKATDHLRGQCHKKG